MDNLNVRQLNMICDEYPKSESMQCDREKTLIVAQRMPSLLSYAKKEFLKDREIALVAVKTDGQSLRFFSEEIRGDEEVVTKAVQTFCKSFVFAVGNARKSLTIAKLVASRGGETIALLDEEFLNSEEVAILAVSRNPRSLCYFSEDIRANKKVVLLALSKDRTAIEFVSDKAFQIKEVFIKAVGGENGKIAFGVINNKTPQGVFDEIERREIKFNLASQNIDFFTVDRDKFKVCLICGVGVIPKKQDLLRQYVIQEDKEIVSLIIEKCKITSKKVLEEVKFASQNRKLRVLPTLMKYSNGASQTAQTKKNERALFLRSLRRKSVPAINKFRENKTEFLADKEIVMLVSSADGRVIHDLKDTEYIKDETFVTECLKSYIVKNSEPPILEGLNITLTDEQAKIACKKDGRNYFYLTTKQMENPEFAVISVASREDVFDGLSETLKKHPDVIKEKELWKR